LQVGDDEFGYMLADVLKDEKVETKGIRFDAQARTALAFVTLRADGEREFMFYRNPSADMLFEVNELDIDLIKKVLLSRTRLRNFRILWGLQISGMYSFLA
jgi:fructokinase